MAKARRRRDCSFSARPYSPQKVGITGSFSPFSLGQEVKFAPMSTAAVKQIETDPIMERLEDQIAWYDRKSLANQRTYKRVKVVEILAAAAIPLLAALKFSFMTMVTGSLGVLITVLEGLLHLNQYQQNWIAFRSTCESLKHEKYTYLGKASPYNNVPDPHALLAERVESLVSQEHAKWASVQQQEPGKEKVS
jgi:hypothetical protein